MKKQSIYKKLIFTSVIAVMILLSAFFKPALASPVFTDLEETPWAEPSINYLVHRGVIDGVGGNQFYPYGILTRGQAAKILALTLELDVNHNEQTDFEDAKNHWSSPYIHALQTQRPGVIDGFPNGSFKPEGLLTREQMAKVITVAFGFEEKEDAPPLKFKDVYGWSTEYIQILASHRIVEGRSKKDFFEPRDHILRAEAVTLIHRAEVASYLTPPREYAEKVIKEQDGVKFEVMYNVTEEKLDVNVKATNMREEAIMYTGRDGCDPGMSVDLFAVEDGQVVVVAGGMRNPFKSCTMAVYQRDLDPGKTIQTFEVLFPPKDGFRESHVLKVGLNNMPLSSPIEIELPLNVK